MLHFLLDIDECETGSQTCHADAHCGNTLGSYTCTCNNGYNGDGFTCHGKIIKTNN